ncbi:hypothetical protein Trco_005272 [Trichoderma cornu-damae]|uniref:Uncharacterized protein n=1 Tax=Trichoderma cornu-damae TaxID=654480 RepID=A0A9P8QJ48_9HYPO|nr:hypothetical protein Trco_005272 [Trichoderma cornu-damae]
MARNVTAFWPAANQRQDLPISEAEDGMLLHLATLNAQEEVLSLDAGVQDTVAASDRFGRNRDGPNGFFFSPANVGQTVPWIFSTSAFQRAPIFGRYNDVWFQKNPQGPFSEAVANGPERTDYDCA